MVKLSEEMIVARTRVSDMENVKKLNCWGAELTDITVLRNLVNVEVLSLSVNCITTLADIQHCVNLQELYIRKNQIQDLNEICWLRSLTKLKNLWLEENPCAQGGEIYRMTVIKNLPQLQKLDNVMVQPDEVGEAMRRGVELVHPHDRPIPGQMVYENNYGPASYQTEPPANTRRLQEEEENDRRQSQGRDPYMVESYDHCPSRRVSNQVFDSSQCRRESVLNSAVQHDAFYQTDSPSTDSLNQSGYGSRRGSQMTSYTIDEGYVPEYHTGRRYSTQDQVPAGTNSRRSSRGVSQQPSDEPMRRSMSLASQQEVPRYQDDESSYASQSPAGRRASEANYSSPSRYDNRSNGNSNATNTNGNTPAEKRATNGTPSPAGSIKNGGRASKNPSPLTSSQASKKSTPTNSKPSSPSAMSKSTMALNGSGGGGKKYCNSCGGNGNGKIVKPVPATHFALNGRAASHQHIEVIHMQQSSTHPSEPNGLQNIGGTNHPLNFRSLQFVQERSQSVPRQNGGSSTGDASPTNISNNDSPCELKEAYTLESERNMVARHYEQTYDQVNHQIDSARQLVEIRKQSHDSPDRPYPRRPKNRNSNILSAVLCLIKELDGPSLEVAEMAVRCRMEELED